MIRKLITVAGYTLQVTPLGNALGAIQVSCFQQNIRLWSSVFGLILIK